MSKPKRKNRHSHKKAVSHNRKPPKGRAPTPRRRSPGSRVPSLTRQQGTRKFVKEILRRILLIVRTKIKDARLRSEFITCIKGAIFEPIWDWLRHAALPYLPYMHP